MPVEHPRDELNRQIPTSIDDPQFIEKLRRALHLTIGQTVYNERRIKELQDSLSSTRLEIPSPKGSSSSSEKRLRRRVLRLAERVEALSGELQDLSEEAPVVIESGDSENTDTIFSHGLLEALGKIEHLKPTAEDPLYEGNTATVTVGEGKHSLRVSQSYPSNVEVEYQALDENGDPDGAPEVLRSRMLATMPVRYQKISFVPDLSRIACWRLLRLACWRLLRQTRFWKEWLFDSSTISLMRPEGTGTWTSRETMHVVVSACGHFVSLINIAGQGLRPDMAKGSCNCVPPVHVRNGGLRQTEFDLH